jgi:hypothetical protein
MKRCDYVIYAKRRWSKKVSAASLDCDPPNPRLVEEHTTKALFGESVIHRPPDRRLATIRYFQIGTPRKPEKHPGITQLDFEGLVVDQV